MAAPTPEDPRLGAQSAEALKALRTFRRLLFKEQLRTGVIGVIQTWAVATIALAVGGTLACLTIKPVVMWITWLWTNLY